MSSPPNKSSTEDHRPNNGSIDPKCHPWSQALLAAHDALAGHKGVRGLSNDLLDMRTKSQLAVQNHTKIFHLVLKFQKLVAKKRPGDSQGPPPGKRDKSGLRWVDTKTIPEAPIPHNI